MCEISDYIYHYTSIEALKKILGTNSLIFSSCANYKDCKAESDEIKKVVRENLDIG